MDTAPLILNAGSSSLKFAIHLTDSAPAPQADYRGSIEEIGRRGRFKVFRAAAGLIDHEVATARLAPSSGLAENAPPWSGIARCEASSDAWRCRFQPAGAGRRFGSGGLGTSDPTEPPASAAQCGGIRALARLCPGLPQVACFDTAFHHTLPLLARSFGLPRDMAARGIRRYDSMASPTSTSPRYCRTIRVPRQRGGWCSPTWAMVPACALYASDAAWKPP